MTDAITLPPVSMADLDPVMALVAAIGWPHRRADIAALIELGRGRLARAGDGRTLGSACGGRSATPPPGCVWLWCRRTARASASAAGWCSSC
jgi:hypothetical protein